VAREGIARINVVNPVQAYRYRRLGVSIGASDGGLILVTLNCKSWCSTLNSAYTYL